MLGRHPREVTGSLWLEHVNGDDRDEAESMIRRSNEGWPTRGELRLTARDGSSRFVEVAVSRVSEDDGGGFTLACHDITVRHDLEQRLTHQAFHDTLTGLANRALFQNRLRHAIDRSRRTGGRFAVLFIDIDDFKTVNDSLGHGAGDTLLRAFASRLEGTLRKQDTAARLGGDEFAVIVEDVLGTEELDELTTRLVEHLSEPLQIGLTEVPVGASIGVALGGSVDDDPDELMRNADIALYEAKAAGKGQSAVYAPAMHATAVDHLQLKADMRRGLNQDEFRVQFQPMFTLDDEAAVIGVEALVRWQHPTRGLLAPSQFVGIAEETGLVVSLEKYIVRARVKFSHGPATINWTSHVFSASSIGSHLQPIDTHEIAEARFVSVDELMGSIRNNLLASGSTGLRYRSELNDSVISRLIEQRILNPG